MEALDDLYAALEYSRERCYLLAQEARDLLTGVALTAGDFDGTLGGMYGHMDGSSSLGNQELLLLLRQLIALLEAGGPFVLSSDLLNIVQGGDVHIHGANVQQPVQRTVAAPLVMAAPPPQPQVATVQYVTTSAYVDESGPNVRALLNPDELHMPMSNADEMNNKMRDLLTKQMYEAAKLESDLHDGAVQDVNTTINEFNGKKQAIARDLATDMQRQLAAANTEADREKIMAEYAQNLSKMTEALEQQKQQQLKALRERLLERRRKSRKELHRTHITEAKALGFSADVVPDLSLASHDEMERDTQVCNTGDLAIYLS